MTETIDFKLTLDAAGANRALDETRKRAEALGGAKESLGKQLTQMKEKLEKGAGAFAALSLAMGNSDTAAGKVLSSAGQLAAAYGAGGPLMLALGAGAAAVSALTTHWDDLIKKQDEALANTYRNADRIAARSQKITEELRRLTGAADGDRAAEIQGDIRRAEADRQTAAMRMAQLTGPARDQAFADIERLNREIRIMQADLDKLERIAKLSAPKATAAPVATGSVSFRVRADYGGYDAAGMEAGYGDDLATQQRLEEQRAEIAKMGVEMRLDALRREHNETMRLAAEEMAIRQQQAGELAGITTALAAATGAAAAGAIAGQDKVLEAFVSAASQAVGGFVQLKGGQLLAEGLVSVLTPGGQALGAGQIAGGAALVAAGAAIQVGGPAAVQGLMGAGAPTSSGSVSTNPARIGTTGGGGRSSHYGGGGTVINIVYGGASGPTADQGAQAVVQGLRRAVRRGLTPVEVR